MEAQSSLLQRNTPTVKVLSRADSEGGGDGDGTGTLTLRGAALTAIRSIAGPAALYSPYGFEEGGIVFAVFMIGATFCLFSWSALNLLEVWGGHRDLDYAEMMSAALGGGPMGGHVINFVTIAQQCGICLTYFVFVARNLQETAVALFGYRPLLCVLCALQLLWYWPLTMLSSIERLQRTSMIANGLVAYSLTVFFSFAIMKILIGVDGSDAEHGRAPIAKHWLFNRTSFFLFVGTSFFMFEGAVANIISIQNAVRNDLKALFPSTFVRVVGFYSLFIALFGFLNWFAFGDQINMILTVNLPNGFWKVSVQVAYSTAVALTFPLQLFPAIETLQRPVSTILAQFRVIVDSKCSSGGLPPQKGLAKWFQSALESTSDRTLSSIILCVVLSGIAMAAIDHLPAIVSFVGALFGIPYSFCFPSFIHLKLVPHSRAWVKNLNVVVIAAGVVLSCVCSALSIWSSLSGRG